MNHPQTKTWAIVVAVGVLASAIAIVPQLEGARVWIVQWWRGLGAVDLPATYPGEVWKQARPEQFSWLAHEWCYPSLRGFRSQFKIEGGVLYRQNVGDRPDRFRTEWIKTEAFFSNKSVLRLRYVGQDWPGNYIDFDKAKPFEWRENERGQNDDGSVVAGGKRLVLSCTKCRLSGDGITYSCDG